MAGFHLLQSLPEELLQHILTYVARRDLFALNTLSHWANSVATPLIWKEVELKDRHTDHPEASAPCATDQHDDTPLIKKLLILATRPQVAACVHSLTHRCHLPPPAIFTELPHTTFSSQTLSIDARTITLVKLAARNLVNVQTLRIILGHPNLTDALLRHLFNKDRLRERPITKLWLENCRFSAGCCSTRVKHPTAYGLPLELDMSGLQSVRFRRLPMRPASEFATYSQPQELDWVYARGEDFTSLSDGQGGTYMASTHMVYQEATGITDADEIHRLHENGELQTQPPFDLFLPATYFDDAIYEELSSEFNFPNQVSSLTKWYSDNLLKRILLPCKSYWLDPLREAIEHWDSFKAKETDIGRLGPSHVEEFLTTPEPVGVPAWAEIESSADVALSLLNTSCSTLRSLNLDWVFTEPQTAEPEASKWGWMKMFVDLFKLRFPHLRAFQLRSAVAPHAMIPPGIYLLDKLDLPSCVKTSDVHVAEVEVAIDQPQIWSDRDEYAGLEFLEYHSNLQCLAWAVDLFFSGRPIPRDIQARIDNIIEKLSRSIEDLRVDATYSMTGELQTEEYHCVDSAVRRRRRLCITRFISKLQHVRSIKIEGGIPRDERREIVRALHASPLEKVVMIGVNWPLGNTWGRNAQDLGDLIQLHPSFDVFEAEHKDAVFDLGMRDPIPADEHFTYEPSFGWPPSAPMLHTIAGFHADSVKELKFCGYQGSPALLMPTPITQPMFAALRHFHSLETVTFSMLLDTRFDGNTRDREVMDYWVNARSSASTALVRVSDEEPEGWELELRTKYAPNAIAWRVTNFISTYLSETAKSRKGGVRVRASFCIGTGGLFDLDCGVGKGAVGSDVCLWHTGPREELDAERRQGKLESRRWF